MSRYLVQSSKSIVTVLLWVNVFVITTSLVVWLECGVECMLGYVLGIVIGLVITQLYRLIACDF
jgi:hypothetical protein